MSRLSSLVLFTLLAAAPEQRPTLVEYQAPVGCPDQAAFQAELAARTDLVRFVPTVREATARVTALVVFKNARFEGSLVVELADGARSKKTLRGPKCETVTRAMTLTAALVLDPENAKTVLPDPPPPVVTPPPPPVVVEPPVVVVPPPPPVVEPVVVEPPAVVVTPVPAPVVQVVELDARVGAWLSTGVSGQVDVGAGGRVGVNLGRVDQPLRFHASFGAAGLMGRTVTATPGSVRYATRLLAELDVAGGFSWRWLRARFGGFVQLAPLFVEGLDGDLRSSSQRWLWAVGPAGTVGVELAGWQVGLRVGVGVALRQESYVIVPRGEVFSVPAASVTGALEVGRAF